MAFPNPKSKLQVFAVQEEAVETARNDFNVNNQFDINDVPKVKGVDIGTIADQTERTVELARNDFSSNAPYNLSDVS